MWYLAIILCTTQLCPDHTTMQIGEDHDIEGVMIAFVCMKALWGLHHSKNVGMRCAVLLTCIMCQGKLEGGQSVELSHTV